MDSHITLQSLACPCLATVLREAYFECQVTIPCKRFDSVCTLGSEPSRYSQSMICPISPKEYLSTPSTLQANRLAEYLLKMYTSFVIKKFCSGLGIFSEEQEVSDTPVPSTVWWGCCGTDLPIWHPGDIPVRVTCALRPVQ